MEISKESKIVWERLLREFPEISHVISTPPNEVLTNIPTEIAPFPHGGTIDCLFEDGSKIHQVFNVLDGSSGIHTGSPCHKEVEFWNRNDKIIIAHIHIWDFDNGSKHKLYIAEDRINQYRINRIAQLEKKLNALTNIGIRLINTLDLFGETNGSS